MHSLKGALIIGLAVATTSCSSTDSTSPSTPTPPPRPEWANGTDWSGTVTLKTGTVLAASFHLETELLTNSFSQQQYWNVAPSGGRIENSLTGVSYLQDFGAYVFEDLLLVDFNEGGVAIDGSAGCLGNGSLTYSLELHPAADGILKGGLYVVCVRPATATTIIEFPPIVMRRVVA